MGRRGPPGPGRRPVDQARAGKLQEYWDLFELIKGMYPASWALGCRDLPAELGQGPSTCSSSGPAARSSTARSSARTSRSRRPTSRMDYADWRALHEGYDAQRTVMYRKILLEDGDLLEFFKTIYFFVECLAVIATVPATTRHLSPVRTSRTLVSDLAVSRQRSRPCGNRSVPASPCGPELVLMLDRGSGQRAAALARWLPSASASCLGRVKAMSAAPNERAWQRTLTCIRFADSRPRPRFRLRPGPSACRYEGDR